MNRYRGWANIGILMIGCFMLAGEAKEHAQAEAVPPALFQDLQWRNIGPFRGGRVVAVAGVPSQPSLYYMGATGGGVWRTEDSGATWTNISDRYFKTGSVGAIAIADSDPNVIYVGMGEAHFRGTASSSGDGVYRSADAGRTWSHLGLELTWQISRIIIDPKNPDVAYVAAQGNPWAPTPARGVYRTSDGGKTWRLVHHGANDSTGASDLAMDPNNPRILYLADWDHQRFPWQIRSGGPGSAIYRTADGGDTWTKLTQGLPNGIMGKIGLAVSPVNPMRIWANIEAEAGGVYRSDDGGMTWIRTTGDRATRGRPWYFMAITADSQNADVVYVLNGQLLKSTDAGKTFAVLRGTHGDQHQLWINPHDSRIMIEGNDGGANITLNGGRTWSTSMNQPTAQIYRVAGDNKFPYFLYGAQQDNTTVAIPSHTFASAIDRPDIQTVPASWFDVGGCESSHIAFDPNDPVLIYASCYQGNLTEYDRRTQSSRVIMPYPALGFTEPPSELKYRFTWNVPLALSPHDPKVIYLGGNVLFRSENRGQSWTTISPDLTRNEKDKQGPGGAPITNEGAGSEIYDTIFYVVESQHERGTIWIGTDDGLVQLTRDEGKT
ncbi:MAG: hypothetical protein ABSH28_19515 [Acidobacteriota bacterium]|jgi:photosystem II stability/assembly factor-like uncharacterized protein